jgi:hypothetical protein
MSSLTGLLKTSDNDWESYVNGTLLAIKGGSPNEIDAAGIYLAQVGYNSGDCVNLIGDDGTAGVNIPVFFVDGANPC